MTTILVLSPKGGSGKSTITRTLAAAAAHDGFAVTTLDTDPQGTVAFWISLREQLEGVPRIDGRTIPIERAASIAVSSGILFVDTPTAIEAYPDAVRELILISDLVLIPSQPLPDDVKSVTPAMTMVRGLRKPAMYVLNRVRTGVKELEVSRARLAQSGDVAGSALPDSVVVVRAMGSGYGPTEVTGRGADESALLWQEVKRRCSL